MKQVNKYSNACGACEAARALAMSGFDSPYSNLTADEYNAKTTAGKVITDLGGVSGLLGLAANVAGTIQQNQQSRTSSSSTGITQEQLIAIQKEAERKQREAEAKAEADRKKAQQTTIIIVIVAVVVVIGTFFMLSGKNKTQNVENQ
jgi:cobalamin biosynthesis Mg chelatase CobN